MTEMAISSRPRGWLHRFLMLTNSQAGSDQQIACCTQCPSCECPLRRVSDGLPRAHRVRWFRGRSSAPASHRQLRGYCPERSTICRHIAPFGSAPRCLSECRGVSGSGCQCRYRRHRNTGTARSKRVASARAIPSAGSSHGIRITTNHTVPPPLKAPKAAAYLSRRARKSQPKKGLAGSLRLAANQTWVEQRFFRRWIEGADNPLFARA
jgi:hypothetical protein